MKEFKLFLKKFSVVGNVWKHCPVDCFEEVENGSRLPLILMIPGHSFEHPSYNYYPYIALLSRNWQKRPISTDQIDIFPSGPKIYFWKENRG